MFRPRLACLVVGNPRRGTVRLAEALTATGSLGSPEEYFWRGHEPDWAHRFQIPSPQDDNYGPYLDGVLRSATTPNGVFSAKLFWGHVDDLIVRSANIPEVADLSGNERFRTIFGEDLRAVHVTRNCLRAAISQWRGEVTDTWTRRDGDPAPVIPAHVDVWRVTVLHAIQHAGDHGWPQLLHSVSVPYITVTYPDIVRELQSVVNEIFTLLGQARLEGTVHEPSLIRQADDATERFIAEWTKATGGCPRCNADTTERLS